MLQKTNRISQITIWMISVLIDFLCCFPTCVCQRLHSTKCIYLSISVSVYLSIYICIYLLTILSIYLPFHLSIRLISHRHSAFTSFLMLQTFQCPQFELRLHSPAIYFVPLRSFLLLFLSIKFWLLKVGHPYSHSSNLMTGKKVSLHGTLSPPSFSLFSPSTF